ncbi:MAG: hypothetical protein IKI91_01920, partial [Clostridia bacterium]|nr:hypothetical protein [Clostridia bacterium]
MNTKKSPERSGDFFDGFALSKSDGSPHQSASPPGEAILSSCVIGSQIILISLAEYVCSFQKSFRGCGGAFQSAPAKKPGPEGPRGWTRLLFAGFPLLYYFKNT